MKTRRWLIVVGAILILLPVERHFFPSHDPLSLWMHYPLPLAFYWNVLGAVWGTILMVAAGCLLLYSGLTSKN